ncbi:hypothetical protein [Streptomyces violascens]|uniref:hypothetical protein n=1 Tax=Streptomyces violascens TaxID=67381 RepID=UPI0036C5F06E
MDQVLALAVEGPIRWCVRRRPVALYRTYPGIDAVGTVGLLLYADTDNRPAHRILFADASLLRIRHPRLAAPWFTALVYLNPMDSLGARFLAPGAPAYPSTHR